MDSVTSRNTDCGTAGARISKIAGAPSLSWCDQLERVLLFRSGSGLVLAVAILTTCAVPAFAQQGSATAGSAGSATVGGNSASTVGAGAVSNSPNGNATAMGVGGSAAGDNSKTRARVHGNNNLNGNAMAMAHDGGDMAKSHTVCHDRSDSAECRTKTMAHEPGGPPVKSTSEGEAAIPQR